MFTTENDKVIHKELLELPREQSFHEASPDQPHPLDDVDVLIAGGMGQGLMAKLERKGIKGVITEESDPDKAVSLYLEGALKTLEP